MVKGSGVVTIVVALLFITVVVNLLADAALMAVDPRLAP